MNKRKEADGCVIVLFGASGDLAARKLIPALYEMANAGSLPKSTCVVGVSRTPMSDDDWRAKLRPSVQEHALDFDAAKWAKFAERLYYFAGDGSKRETYPELSRRVEALSTQRHCRGNVLFYLSVAPSLYEPIIECIHDSGMVLEGRRWCSINRDSTPWQRIIVEKPFGHDAASAASLNRALGRAFEEDAIYRIDHYLAKELVQNLLVLRFANTIFEPIWNHRYIDHVQITAAETVGVGLRGDYYDSAGAIRDMIQSHLLQVAALVAMEPPTRYTAHHIRQEKIKIVDAIVPTPTDQLEHFAAFGQYAGDASEPGYHQLPGVKDGSTTETFAAIALQFNNWRWAGTPFYLRTGKRMATKRTEIVIQFKQPAADLFGSVARPDEGDSARDTTRPANQIVIEIAPRECVSLRFEGKVPGQRMLLDSVSMDFDYAKRFNAEPVEAYGPLLLDAMRGDQTLFKHRLEVESAWDSMMPFLGPESAALRKNMAGNYTPGSWGPRSSDELLARHGRAWHNEA